MKSPFGNKYIVSIAHGRTDKMVALAEKAFKMGAGGVELRCDYLINSASRNNLLATFPKPSIVTLRHRTFGGLYNGPEKERMDYLEAALRAGASLIDLDFYPGMKLPQSIPCEKIILSHHHSSAVSEDIIDTVKKMAQLKPGFIKIAVTPNNTKGLVLLKSIYDMKWDIPIIAFGMGEVGSPTRILALNLGSPWTYCRMEGATAIAPGQWDLESVKGLYGKFEEKHPTHIFGITGWKLSNTRSPMYHNHIFHKKGISAFYLPFPLPGIDNLKVFMEKIRIKGLSVTTPHKERVVDFIDERSEEVKNCGACNTVVLKKGTLYGYNTDVNGMVSVLKGLPEEPRSVAIIGCGGAARAVALALRHLPKVTLCVRNASKGQRVADSLGVSMALISDFESIEWDLLINASTSGSDGKSFPVPSHLLNGIMVLDLIYSPEETPLIIHAKKRGLFTVNGRGFFEAQAAAQSSIFLESIKNA